MLNRTKRVERFAGGPVAGREVLVASSFDHPVRGPVLCPGAAVLARALSAAGLAARVGPMSIMPGGAAAGQDLAEVSAVTYLDPLSGAAVGLAAASHPADAAAVARTVAAWAGAIRTRRVLVAVGDAACGGACQTQRMIECAADAGRGPGLVGGPGWLGGRSQSGSGGRDVRFTVDPGAVAGGGTVVWAARGVSRAVRSDAAACGMQVVDGTCPLVAAGRARVREFSGRGDLVVLVGSPNDAAAASYAGQAAGPVAWVAGPGDAQALTVDDLERVSFVIQCGAMTVPEAARVLAVLRSRFPRLRGQHPDEWCYASADRAATVAAVAEQADLLLVCGPDDGDRAYLTALAATAGTPVVTLSSPADLAALGPDALAPVPTIAVVATASASAGLGEAVVGVLRGLGPASVVDQAVTSRVRQRPGPMTTVLLPGAEGERFSMAEAAVA